jgi:acyl-coenzyme A thioesterase 13
METIGGELEVWEEGRIVMSLLLEPKHMNPRNILHGGVLMTLMDEAAGAVVASARGLHAMRAEPHATVDMNVSFLSGAVPGELVECEAKTLRVGRSVCFAEVEVRNRGSGRTVAKGRFTFAIIKRHA